MSFECAKITRIQTGMTRYVSADCAFTVMTSVCDWIHDWLAKKWSLVHERYGMVRVCTHKRAGWGTMQQEDNMSTT